MAIIRETSVSPAAPPASSGPDRITAAIGKLTASAKTINDVSDELAAPIRAIEQALERLNIGVACWTTISAGSEAWDYWSHDVGYTSGRDGWFLAIRTVKGDERVPERETEDVWAFNDAPRWLRTKAVDKLPDLIEALVEATNAAAKRLAEKVASAQEIATAVDALLNPKNK